MAWVFGVYRASTTCPLGQSLAHQQEPRTNRDPGDVWTRDVEVPSELIDTARTDRRAYG